MTMVDKSENAQVRHVVDDLRVGGRSRALSWLPSSVYRALVRPFAHRVPSFIPDAQVSPHEIRAVDDAQRAARLKSLFNFALRSCLDAGHEHWGLHAFTFRPGESEAESVAKLRAFARAQVLRWSGDVEAFLAIDSILRQELGFEGGEDDRFHRDLARLLVDAFARLAAGGPADTERRPLVLSLILLDEQQFQRFTKLCLPSLLAEGNCEELRTRRKPLLLVSARGQQRKAIEQMNLAGRLGCEVEYRNIPDDLARGMVGERRDMIVAALRTLHFLEAGRLGADVHPLEPHRLYCEGYFRRLLDVADRGMSVIMVASLRVKEEAIQRVLHRRRNGECLSLFPMDLVDLALDHLHPADEDLVRAADSDDARLPHRRSLGWIGGDELRICSAKPSLCYLGREVTRHLPLRFFSTDARAVARVQPLGDTLYVPEARDALVQVDVMSEWLDSSPRPEVGLGEFKESFWDNLDDWEGQLFTRPSCLPTGKGAVDARKRIPRDRIDAEIKRLTDALGPFHPFRSPEQLSTVLYVLQGYEASVYGRGDMARIVEEVKRAFSRMVTDKGTIAPEVRRDLIRYALNFDQIGVAAELANSGAADTVFESEFIHYARRTIERNQIHANSIRSAAGDVRISVIGSIVWGAAYVRKYLDFHIASLLAPGNIPALAKDGLVVLSVITTQRGREQIEAHPVFPLLQQHARVQFTLFDEGFLKRREQAGYNFYFFYGMLDHLNVYLARHLGADLYLLPVDCVYSADALSNLRRHLDVGADCCSVSGVETDEEGFLSAIEADRKGALVLDVDGASLLKTAVAHAGRYYRSLIMSPENVAFARHPRELVWPVDGGFVTHSVFMHPLAVSFRMLVRPFWPNHENVDYGLVPRLLGEDGRMHVVADASEVAIAHFSPPQVRDDYVSHGFSLRRFVEAHDHDYSVHREFFNRRQFFPCAHPEYPVSSSYAEELATIRAAFRLPHYHTGDEGAAASPSRESGG